MHYAEEGVVRGLIKQWIDVAPLVMACVRCAPVSGQRALVMRLIGLISGVSLGCLVALACFANAVSFLQCASGLPVCMPALQGVGCSRPRRFLDRFAWCLRCVYLPTFEVPT